MDLRRTFWLNFITLNILIYIYYPCICKGSILVPMLTKYSNAESLKPNNTDLC